MEITNESKNLQENIPRSTIQTTIPKYQIGNEVIVDDKWIGQVIKIKRASKMGIEYLVAPITGIKNNMPPDSPLGISEYRLKPYYT